MLIYVMDHPVHVVYISLLDKPLLLCNEPLEDLHFPPNVNQEFKLTSEPSNIIRNALFWRASSFCRFVLDSKGPNRRGIVEDTADISNIHVSK